MSKVGGLALILIFLSFEAQACSFASPERRAPVNDLIRRTNNIVLARVIKAEYNEPKKLNVGSEEEKEEALTDLLHGHYKPIKYTFEVIDLIKGKSHKFFIMNTNYSFNDSDFNLHKDEQFWKDEGGAMGPCAHDERGFDVGYVYLMFLDKPYHRKSFELIRNYKSDDAPNSKDKWLSYVEAKVAGQQ